MFGGVLNSSLVSNIQYLSRNLDKRSKKRRNGNEMGRQDSANQFDFRKCILIFFFFFHDTIVKYIIASRDEYTPLFDFVNTKKLRIKNKGLKSGVSNLDQMIDSDDDEHDAYLQKVKQEGREKEEDYEDDDSDESEGRSLLETGRGGLICY